ncbi:hypothetical protein BC833DRAFT_600380 [Globomyces pollinis-pini]|nr:hypothetical protein BC833DRAFT_600380 [Globomyces pollinis-pini]
MQVGFIGLGSMGVEIAKNLQSKHHLKVHNRTKSKASELIEMGSEFLSIPDLTQSCDLIFSMLFDDACLETTFKEICKVGKSNLIFMDLSTCGPETTDRMYNLAKEYGITYLAGPVFGRPDAARSKMLVNLVAGDVNAKKVVMPYLKLIGRKVIDVGDDPSKANVCKLIGNFMIASQIEVLAEAHSMAEKCGINRGYVMDFVESMMPGRVIEGYGARIKAKDYQIKENQAGFGVNGGLKDVGLMKNLASTHDIHMPMLDIMLSHLSKVDKKDLDWSSLAESVEQQGFSKSQ